MRIVASTSRGKTAGISQLPSLDFNSLTCFLKPPAQLI